MKQRLLLLFGCILLQTGSVFSQSNAFRKNDLSIGLGYQQINFLDHLSSPLIYSSNGGGLLLGYRHHTEKSLFQLSVEGYVGEANPKRFGTREYDGKIKYDQPLSYELSSLFIHCDIRGAYFRKISHEMASPFTFMAGSSISESAFFADAVADFPWFFNIVSISPSIHSTFHLNDRSDIHGEIDIPVLSLVTRMPYSVFPKSATETNFASLLHQGTRIATLDNYQAVRLTFSYEYAFTNRSSVSFNYRFRWIHDSHNYQVYLDENKLSLSYSFHF